ncbi:cation transport protein-domain-containing protein [Dactylonectria estremocensis]|uniref:Potassium transport protein n=1 Tax=Dactylonectria estremocensis TaxID=1079267 RepID=A0A9P9E6M7_9HYPO|nr:cation transport protein-domain-containing protein [Dactylonectria estremocensis]
MFGSIKESWNDLLQEHPRLASLTSTVGSVVPPINYITLHYAYFILGSLLFSVILWGSSNPAHNIEFIDCMFLVVSSFTNTGLNSVDLSKLTTWQQVLLWILFIIGSVIWVSFWTVLARKHAFEKRFEDIVEAERESRKRRAALKQTPRLKQLFFIRRFKTSPATAEGVLPGLGTRQRTSEKTEEALSDPNDLLSVGVNVRRTVSCPEDSAPSDTEDHPSRTTTLASEADISPQDHIRFAESFGRRPQRINGISIYQHDTPGTDGDTRRPSTADSVNSDQSEDFLLHWKRILGHHNVSRRGQFFDLSSDEREALGGCEYRALKILAVTVPMYGFLWQALGGLALGAWIAVNNPTAASDYGANPWWSGIFLSVSAFNNAGMSVIDAGMTVFQGSYFVLFVVGLLILAGNTAYPLFLRFILWSMLKILELTPCFSSYGPWQETVEFILKYPRRVYTTLFPSGATWWLLLILLLINTIDWVAFEVLNIGNPTVEALPMADRIFAGWFQAIAVRAAGFAVVSMSSLYPAVQLLYMVMMYVSVYPVSITMRHSNVYEERSLGIYDNDPAVAEQAEGGITTLPSNTSDDPAKRHLRRRATAAVISKTVKRSMTFQGVGVPPAKGPGENSPVSFIGQQIRGQLAHDLWWLVVPLLIIMIIETDHFLDQPLAYSIFNVLFEVVSAYGCVGLSIGLPGANYSFSGGMHPGSKVVLCIVMLRGRHRGLPVALDKAVRLPGLKLHKQEEEDSRLRRTMTMNRITSRDN